MAAANRGNYFRFQVGLDSDSGFSRPVPNPGSGREGTRELTSGRDSGRANKVNRRNWKQS